MTAPDDAIELDRRRRRALVAGDVTELRDLLDPACRYVHANGRVQSGADYLDAFEAGVFRYASVETDELTVTELAGATTVLGFRQRAVLYIGEARTDSRASCTAVWSARGGTTRLVAFQATPVT